MTNLRRLVWLYLVLLIFEGALRKWVVPALDAPLLLIRDPVVILIYVLAVRNRLSFSSPFFTPNLVLAIVTAITATIFGLANPIVTVYGLRTDYLQIPLIFIIPQILHREDVIAMGRFLFWTSMPMAVLVVLQFHSPTDSIWNKGAMATHYGTVRPCGTFSFTNGLADYYALTFAFLMYGYVKMGTYKLWLSAPATFLVLLGAAVSGSRSCLVSLGLVAVVAVLCVMIQGRGGVGILVAGALVFIGFLVLSTLPVFQEGSAQLAERFADAGAQEGNTAGFINRFVTGLIGPFDEPMGDVPFFGNGLGLGTNGAAAMLHGNREFIGPEGEWGRLIWECGFLLGFLLCVFRFVLAVAIGLRAYEALRRGNMLAPLIFAACGLLVLNGQWGGPTVLGFAILGGGLTLAACVEPPEPEDDEHEDYEHEDEEEDEDEEVEGKADHLPAAGTVG